MRADRLIAVLLFLQAKGRVTAAEVAQELEVSERTARRDLEALAISGVPVYSRHGRGGGWELVGGATTDLTGLSAAEARAMFLTAGPALEASPELQSAMRKLTGALPEAFRAEAQAAAAAIKVDSSGWSRVGVASTPEPLELLSEAVISGTQVQMHYDSRSSAAGPRTVHPLGLVTKRNVWYLVANTDHGVRTYRLSRISDVAVLDLPVERPEDFDLDEEWERIVTSFASQTDGFEVRAHCVPALLGPLRWMFSNMSVLGEMPDGRIEVVIGGYNDYAFAGQVAGFGSGLELLDPPPGVEAELRRITRELVERYG